MKSFWRAHRALERLATLPAVEPFFRRRYDRRFENNGGSNLFRGVFDTFEAAALSSPANRPLGYDNESSASLYAERTRLIHATDYPVLFWLQKLFAEGRHRVYDLGGHIGVSYYAYRKVLAYPPGLRWSVHDVPTVMARGLEIAVEKDRARVLAFSDQFEDAANADVLLAMGSLQYLPDTLAERLSALPNRPPHLLLNLTPLHERHAYFTLQGIGTAYCPYRIAAIPAFLESLAALGYDLVDQWENPDKKCEIPFHPEYSLDRYYGFHFRRHP